MLHLPGVRPGRWLNVLSFLKRVRDSGGEAVWEKRQASRSSTWKVEKSDFFDTFETMKQLLFSLLVCLVYLPLGAQSADSATAAAGNVEGLSEAPEKVHNEIFKVNLFPMIGGRLAFSYELGMQSKDNQSSLLFGLESFGTFSLIQYEINTPKGFSASLAYRRYFNQSVSQPLDGGFVQLSGGLGFMNHIEKRSVMVTPTQYLTVDERMNNPHATIFVGVGKQFVLYKRFALEYMLGLGAYITSNDLSKEAFYAISPQNTPTVFGFWNYEDTPLALTCGIKMGYVFGGFFN